MAEVAWRNLVWAAWLVTAPVWAGEAYRWVDADGNVHYSAQPPPGHEATRMQLRREPAPAPAPVQSSSGAAGTASATDAEVTAKNAAALREYAEQMRVQCANARDIAERLRTRPAAVYEREDGSYQRYADEERERMIAESEAFLRENCD